MNVSIGIVRHPARNPEQLIARTRPNVVSVDEYGWGTGRNHLETLLSTWEHAYQHQHEWVVILEDDAVVRNPFRTELAACLSHAPEQVVSLYLGTGYPAQYQRHFMDAIASDPSWILHRYLRHAVAYAIKRELTPVAIAHARPLIDKGWAMDDALSEFCRKNSQLVAYSNPSLVDHEDGRSVVSSRKHLGRPTFGRKRPRRAHNFTPPLTWDDTVVVV